MYGAAAGRVRLKDSIMAIGDRQFGYIRTYSSTLALEEDAGEARKLH